MQFRRALILAAALGVLSAPSLAQSPYPAGPPAPVPALPDAARITTYTISGTTCACAVNFQLYGDGVDFQSWVEVWLNGAPVAYNDVTNGWSLSTPSGSFATLARPITNAVLTFNNVQTGTVQIIGNRKPRRTAQFSENRGVPARDLNQALTDIIATQRETWDRTADVTGRALLAPPGETIGALPKIATRQNGLLGFDGSGNPLMFSPGTGGTVVGPNTSTDGSLACFNGTTGQLLRNCSTDPNGIAASTAASSATVPTLLPNRASANTGIGGLTGNVAIISNGAGVANFSSSTGATVATPAANSGNTQIATTLYADRAGALKLIDSTSGTPSNQLNMAAADGVTTISDPPVDGQVVDFIAPITPVQMDTSTGLPQQIKLKVGAGTAYAIRTPNGGQLVQGQTLTSTNNFLNANSQGTQPYVFCDICQGSAYRGRFVSAANGGPYWQLMTPADAHTYSVRTNVPAYYQTTGGPTTWADTAVMTFSPYVYDPDDHKWKYVAPLNLTSLGNQSSGVTTSGGGATSYVDGVQGPLAAGHMNFVFAFIKLGQGGSNPTVSLNYVSRYFDGNFGGSEGGSLAGYILGGTLTITTALSGNAIRGGEVIACSACNPGSYIDAAGCDGNGFSIGNHCLVHGTATAFTSLVPGGINTKHPKYYPGPEGVEMFVSNDGGSGTNGNPVVGTLVAQQYVSPGGHINSYFGPFDNTSATIQAGELPGTQISNSFLGGLPQQRLTITYDPLSPTTGVVPTASLVELAGVVGSGGFINVGQATSTTEIQYIKWDWEPIADYRPRISFTCTTAGEKIHLQIKEVPTWSLNAHAPALVAATTYDKTKSCPGAAYTFDFDPVISWSYTDGHFIAKMLAQLTAAGGGAPAGTATFAAAPQARIGY